MDLIRLQGTVVKGVQRGRKMNSPTINISGDFDLEYGIYACKVKTSKGDFLGGMHFGPRITFNEDKPVMEIRLIDFEGDLYGETVKIDVYNKIREIRKYDSVDALKAQIEKDIEYIKKNYA